MIVITTPAGQIGRRVLGNLLESGEQLRVIARDREIAASGGPQPALKLGAFLGACAGRPAVDTVLSVSVLRKPCQRHIEQCGVRGLMPRQRLRQPGRAGHRERQDQPVRFGQASARSAAWLAALVTELTGA